MTDARGGLPVLQQSDYDAVRRAMGRVYTADPARTYVAAAIGLRSANLVPESAEVYFYPAVHRGTPLQPTIWTWRRGGSGRRGLRELIADHALNSALSHGLVDDPSDIGPALAYDEHVRTAAVEPAGLRVDGVAVAGSVTIGPVLAIEGWRAAGAVVDAGYAVTLVGPADFVAGPVTSRSPFASE